MPRETPAALQAFEDYWAMGVERSVRDLVQTYRQRRANGEQVPTTRHVTIGRWSSQHGWQARCFKRAEEEADYQRQQFRERAAKQRERELAIIEVSMGRLAKRLQEDPGLTLAEDAKAFKDLATLYHQLVEEPLKERHEVTGADGGPLEVVYRVVDAGKDNGQDSDDESGGNGQDAA